MSAPAADSASRWRTAFFLLLAVLAALPPLVARYPQMTDYPAHLARWHVMLDGGRSPWLARYYAIDFRWMPNLGVDLLIDPLARLFGLEGAGRLVVIAIPLLTGMALLALDRALGRKGGAGTALAFAAIWAPALVMGFVNFALAVALALFALAGWIAGEGRWWRAPLLLVLAPLVWLCHLSGWGVLSVLVFCVEWDRRGFWRAIPATWPCWPPLLLTVLTGSGARGALGWGDGVVMDKLSNWVMALADRDARLDIGVTVLLIVLPLVALGRGRIDWRMGRAAILLAVLSILLPRHLGGGDFADYRLVPLALMAWALAIDWRGPGWALVLAAVPFALRIAVTTAGWIAGSRETGDMLEVVALLPVGARVAVAELEPVGSWGQAPFSHAQSYATVRRDALVNSHFAIPGVHMLRLKTEPANFTDPSQRLRLPPGEAPDLAAFASAARADWLWYYGAVPPARLPAGAQVVAVKGHSLLARLAKGDQDR
jgi:hypothetical protein